MSAKGEHKTDLRNAILKEVYEENLRIVGRSPGNPLPGKQAQGYRKLVLLLFVIVVTVVGLLPGLTTSLHSDGTEARKLVKAPIPVPHKQPEVAAAASTSHRQPPWRPAEAPNLAWFAPKFYPLVLDKHRYLNYSLLFSRKNDVRLFSLFGLAVKTIVIDPGHGGKDPGAIGALGTEEKNITLDVARRLKARLNQLGNYHVVLTRDADTTVSLAKRVQIANAEKAGLFISIHVNALPDKYANVVETYYYGPPQNAATLQLAKQENKDSGYAVGELKTLVQNITNTVKWQESVRLATSIQKSLYSNVQHPGEDGFRTGIRQAPFVVLLGVNAPSVLAEISCITNIKEEKKLDTAAYREEIASYLEKGIVNYLQTRSLHNVRGKEAHERERRG